MTIRMPAAVLALAVFGLGPAFAPTAMAQDDAPVITLNKEAFNAARAVEIGTATRQKLYADYSTLWGGIIRDQIVDADELAFLQMQVDGVKQVRLKGAATADWAPADVVFNGNWSQTGGGGFDAPLVYIRARLAWWMADKTPVADLAGDWPELNVNASVFDMLKADAIAPYSRRSNAAASLGANLRTREPDAAIRARIIETLVDGPMILLVRSEAGGDAVAFTNVWETTAKFRLRELLPYADLFPLWTGEPADILKLAGRHAKSPEDAQIVVDFLARQLAPRAAESLPANAWQPLRSYVAGAKAQIKLNMPEADRPAARQLLHDAVKQVAETMTPRPSSVLYTFALTE